MPRCFVIQPFDKGKFDKRYEDVFSPAIVAAGLEPYRVDRDPGVEIPIEEIQSGIESSELCLAEITTDNPNVWFELGYAIASQKSIVIVCSDERTARFPFDIQHRSIIQYSTESASDYKMLSSKITVKLTAFLSKKEALGEVSKISSVVKLEGLDQHEIAALVTIAQSIDDSEDGVPTYRIREDMTKAGFSKIAVTLGLISLEKKGMIISRVQIDYREDEYRGYAVSASGLDWLFANQGTLNLYAEPTKQEITPAEEDDLPF